MNIRVAAPCSFNKWRFGFTGHTAGRSDVSVLQMFRDSSCNVAPAFDPVAQDGAAEVAAHLSVRGHVPPSVLGEAEPQSLGVLLLLLREQVTPTRAPQVIASRPQSSPLLSPLALPDTPCRCSPPCSTWCAPTTPSDTASRTTTYCSPTNGSSWWSRRCRSSS